MNLNEFLICMGYDAMRVAMGLKPKNYSVHEVSIWIQCISGEQERITNLEEFIQHVSLRENGSNYKALRKRAKELLNESRCTI